MSVSGHKHLPVGRPPTLPLRRLIQLRVCNGERLRSCRMMDRLLGPTPRSLPRYGLLLRRPPQPDKSGPVRRIDPVWDVRLQLLDGPGPIPLLLVVQAIPPVLPPFPHLRDGELPVRISYNKLSLQRISKLKLVNYLLIEKY